MTYSVSLYAITPSLGIYVHSEDVQDVAITAHTVMGRVSNVWNVIYQVTVAEGLTFSSYLQYLSW